MNSQDGELAFSFQVSRNGDVSILRHARLVTTLRAAAARDFLAEVEVTSHAEQQQLMARLTGNYKRGNERLAANHPRNRGPANS